MISYVCCKYRDDVFARHLEPSLALQCERYGAELVVVSHPSSIFEAYEEGRRKARFDLVVYVHDDVAVLDPLASEKIARAFEAEPRRALLGVAGSRKASTLPWWHNRGPRCGHWVEPDRNGGLVYYRAEADGFVKRPLAVVDPYAAWESLPSEERWLGCAEAGLLDGLFLAEHRSRLDLPWDTDSYSGWHAYDADRCLQVRAAGLEVAVVDVLVAHHEQPHARRWFRNAGANFRCARKKWKLRRSLETLLPWSRWR